MQQQYRPNDFKNLEEVNFDDENKDKQEVIEPVVADDDQEKPKEAEEKVEEEV